LTPAISASFASNDFVNLPSIPSHPDASASVTFAVASYNEASDAPPKPPLQPRQPRTHRARRPSRRGTAVLRGGCSRVPTAYAHAAGRGLGVGSRTAVIHGSFMRHLTGMRAAAAWPPIVRKGATIDAPA
jgi:hypothetical protein